LSAIFPKALFTRYIKSAGLGASYGNKIAEFDVEYFGHTVHYTVTDANKEGKTGDVRVKADEASLEAAAKQLQVAMEDAYVAALMKAVPGITKPSPAQGTQPVGIPTGAYEEIFEQISRSKKALLNKFKESEYALLGSNKGLKFARLASAFPIYSEEDDENPVQTLEEGELVLVVSPSKGEVLISPDGENFTQVELTGDDFTDEEEVPDDSLYDDNIDLPIEAGGDNLLPMSASRQRVRSARYDVYTYDVVDGEVNDRSFSGESIDVASGEDNVAIVKKVVDIFGGDVGNIELVEDGDGWMGKDKNSGTPLFELEQADVMQNKKRVKSGIKNGGALKVSMLKQKKDIRSAASWDLVEEATREFAEGNFTLDEFIDELVTAGFSRADADSFARSREEDIKAGYDPLDVFSRRKVRSDIKTADDESTFGMEGRVAKPAAYEDGVPITDKDGNVDPRDGVPDEVVDDGAVIPPPDTPANTQFGAVAARRRVKSAITGDSFEDEVFALIAKYDIDSTEFWAAADKLLRKFPGKTTGDVSDVLSEEGYSSRMSSVVRRLRSGVEEGDNLGEALDLAPDIVDEEEVSANTEAALVDFEKVSEDGNVDVHVIAFNKKGLYSYVTKGVRYKVKSSAFTKAGFDIYKSGWQLFSGKMLKVLAEVLTQSKRLQSISRTGITKDGFEEDWTDEDGRGWREAQPEGRTVDKRNNPKTRTGITKDGAEKGFDGRQSSIIRMNKTFIVQNENRAYLVKSGKFCLACVKVPLISGKGQEYTTFVKIGDNYISNKGNMFSASMVKNLGFPKFVVVNSGNKKFFAKSTSVKSGAYIDTILSDIDKNYFAAVKSGYEAKIAKLLRANRKIVQRNLAQAAQARDTLAGVKSTLAALRKQNEQLRSAVQKQQKVSANLLRSNAQKRIAIVQDKGQDMIAARTQHLLDLMPR
jgi:hypothetical protein